MPSLEVTPDNKEEMLLQSAKDMTAQHEQCAKKPTSEGVKARARSRSKGALMEPVAAEKPGAPSALTTNEAPPCNAKPVPECAKETRRKVGGKRNYTGPYIFSADGIKAAYSEDSLKSANYKETLSHADQGDIQVLSKGVLLTHEHDIRTFTRRRALRKLLKKVQNNAVSCAKATNSQPELKPGTNMGAPKRMCTEANQVSAN